jgi:phage shock protein A
VDVGVSVAVQVGLAGARLVTGGEVGQAAKAVTAGTAQLVGGALQVGIAAGTFEVAREVKTGDAQVTQLHAQLDRLQGALGELLADTKALRGEEQTFKDASRRGGSDEAVMGSVRKAADAMAELRRAFLSMGE